MISTERSETSLNNGVKALNESQTSSWLGLTPRAVLIGMISMVLVGLHGLYAGYTSEFGSLNLAGFPSSGGLLMVTILLISNIFMKRARFDAREMAIVYVFHLISGTVYLQGVVGFSLVNMAVLGALALQNPGSYALIVEKMSSLVAVKDQDAVMGFWIGGQSVPWKLWIGPMIFWTVFWVLLFWVFVCLATLVRRRWTEIERLRYPLVVPVAELITGTSDVGRELDNSTPIWENRLAQIAAILVFIYTTLQFLYRYFPLVPHLRSIIPIGTNMTESPWYVLQEWPAMCLRTDPAFYGVSYLLSTELLFSLWFFYLLIQKIIPIYIATTQGTFVSPIYFDGGGPHAFGRGAFIGLLLVELWIMRRELAEIFLRAVGIKKPDSVGDENEPISFALAVWSGLAALVVFSVISVKILHIDVGTYLVFMFIFFMVIVGFARLRAEAGSMVEQPATETLSLDLIKGMGSQAMGKDTLFSFFVYFNPMITGWVGLGVANLLDSYALGDAAKVRRRSITVIAVLAFVLAIVSGYLFMLPVVYDRGMFNLHQHYQYHGGMGVTMVSREASYMEPETWKVGRTYIFGTVMGFVFMILRTKFLWWPFHPLGLAIAPNSFMTFYWGPAFLIWILKVALQRYAGTRIVKKLYPFFLSLILSSVVIQGFYSILGFIITVLS